MRLLLAEDEAAMSEALKDILIYHKYQVDTVDNGEDALAYAQVGEYDGIILDIMMPKMDGLQVLSVLRGRGSRTACSSASAPKYRQHLKPIHFRHHNIENNPVVFPYLRISQRVFAVIYRIYLIFMIYQDIL